MYTLEKNKETLSNSLSLHSVTQKAPIYLNFKIGLILSDKISPLISLLLGDELKYFEKYIFSLDIVLFIASILSIYITMVATKRQGNQDTNSLGKGIFYLLF